MTGYPAIRIAAVSHRCHSNGCIILPGKPYLRTFYPPDEIYPNVIVSHRCEPCAITQGHGSWFANTVPA